MDELTDEQWEVIRPLLPAHKRRGRPRVNDRKVLNGILYVLRSGCAWGQMPRDYGNYVTCWRRLSQWADSGVWERIWRAVLAGLEQRQKLDWSRAFLDGSFVPAKRGETAWASPSRARAQS